MFDSTPISLDRDELSKISPNHRAIKFFESLAAQTSQVVPSEIESVSIESSLALANANEALAEISRLKDIAINVENILQVFNNTGSTIQRGKVVYVSGVGINNIPEVELMISNGSIRDFLLIGVTDSEISNGNSGFINLYGYINNIDTSLWSLGDLLYISSITAGVLTNSKPLPPNLIIPVGIVLKSSPTEGIIYVRPILDQVKSYGTFIYSGNYTALAINTAYNLSISSSSNLLGLSVGSPSSRAVFLESGAFNITFTVHVENTGGGHGHLWVWVKKNGVNVNGLATSTAIKANTNISVAASFSISISSGDYIELAWATDDLNVLLNSIPATAFAPSVNAVTLIVNQIN